MTLPRVGGLQETFEKIEKIEKFFQKFQKPLDKPPPLRL